MCLVKATWAQPTDATGTKQKIMSQIIQQHPNASDFEWEKRGNNFGVEFEQQDVDFLYHFDQEGNLIQTSRSISLPELPAAIINQISSMYDHYEIENSAMINRNGQNYYLLEIEHGIFETDKLFNPDGTTLSLKSIIN